DDVVRVIAGDAFAEIPALGGTFDMVFLDAWKPDYVKFLELTLPRLERGGVFVAHNVINKRDEMLDFLEAIERSPDLVTSIVSAGSEGLLVSVRRCPRGVSTVEGRFGRCDSAEPSARGVSHGAEDIRCPDRRSATLRAPCHTCT